MRRLLLLAMLLLLPALASARIPGAMFYLMDTPKSMASFEAHAGKIGVVVPTWYHVDESGLVSGEVAYGPEPLDKPADGNLLVCCSQPVRDVVIDL